VHNGERFLNLLQVVKLLKLLLNAEYWILHSVPGTGHFGPTIC